MEKKRFIQQFSKQELRVIELICKGYPVREISSALKLSPKNTEKIKYKLYEKLKVDDAALLAVEAIKRKLYIPKPAKLPIKSRNGLFTADQWETLTLLQKGYQYNTIGKKKKLTPFALDQVINSIHATLKKQSFMEGRAELTKNEILVIRYTCRGLSTEKIASLLKINIKVAGSIREKVYKKLSVKNSASLAVYAVCNGIYKI